MNDRTITMSDPIVIKSDRRNTPSVRRISPSDPIVIKSDRRNTPSDRRNTPGDPIVIKSDHMNTPGDRTNTPGDPMVIASDRTNTPRDPMSAADDQICNRSDPKGFRRIGGAPVQAEIGEKGVGRSTRVHESGRNSDSVTPASANDVRMDCKAASHSDGTSGTRRCADQRMASRPPHWV